jgi:hypothetical protein
MNAQPLLGAISIRFSCVRDRKLDLFTRFSDIRLGSWRVLGELSCGETINRSTSTSTAINELTPEAGRQSFSPMPHGHGCM